MLKDNVGCANNDAQDVSSEKETNKQKLTQTQAQKDNVVRKKKTDPHGHGAWCFDIVRRTVCSRAMSNLN